SLLGLTSGALLDEREAQAHRMERVVEVVGDAGRELADGPEPFLLHERFAKPIELVLGAHARRRILDEYRHVGRARAVDRSVVARLDVLVPVGALVPPGDAVGTGLEDRGRFASDERLERGVTDLCFGAGRVDAPP